MNRDLMHQKLMKLGFSKIEAKVFVQLTTEGSQSSRDIAKALNLNICQISNILFQLHAGKKEKLIS
ncbi:MAG: helix-turn-helix domain-containing protein [Candidatus Bathyarchaeota archaeon]